VRAGAGLSRPLGSVRRAACIARWPRLTSLSLFSPRPPATRSRPPSTRTRACNPRGLPEHPPQRGQAISRHPRHTQNKQARMVATAAVAALGGPTTAPARAGRLRVSCGGAECGRTHTCTPALQREDIAAPCSSAESQAPRAGTPWAPPPIPLLSDDGRRLSTPRPLAQRSLSPCQPTGHRLRHPRPGGPPGLHPVGGATVSIRGGRRSAGERQGERDKKNPPPPPRSLHHVPPSPSPFSFSVAAPPARPRPPPSAAPPPPAQPRPPSRPPTPPPPRRRSWRPPAPRRLPLWPPPRHPSGLTASAAAPAKGRTFWSRPWSGRA